MFSTAMQRMIIHESVEITDKNIVFFLLLLSKGSQHVFLRNIFLKHRLDIFLFFSEPKELMPSEFLFSIL